MYWLELGLYVVLAMLNIFFSVQYIREWRTGKDTLGLRICLVLNPSAAIGLLIATSLHLLELAA